MPQIPTCLSWKPDLAEISFFLSASRVCELKDLALDVLNLLLKESYVEKQACMSYFAHFLVQNGE